MCFFITVLIKPRKKADQFKQVLESYGKNISDVNDCGIQDFLKEDEVYWYATSNTCDCDTQLGSYLNPTSNRVSLKGIKKLEKKGWSKSKVERYITEKEKLNKKNLRVLAQHNNNIQDVDDPDGWKSICNDIFKVDRFAKVGIIKHWYSQKLKPEVIMKANRVEIKFDDKLSEKLLRIEEDKCYIITN